MRSTFVFIMLLASFAGFAQTSEHQKFAFEFFNKLNENTDDNIVVSPLSVQLALCMQMNGANGNTLEQMKKATHTESYSMEEINQFYRNILDKFHEENNEETDDSEKTDITISNSLWANSSVSFLSDFMNANQNYYNAHIESIAFDSNAGKRIDDWICESTDGMIPSANIDLDTNSMLVTICSMLFKSGWNVGAYEEIKREDLSFHNADGTTVTTPSLVFEDALTRSHDGYMEGCMTLGNEERYEFNVYLPIENNDSFSLSEDLDNSGRFDHAKIQLPCFDISDDINIIPALKALGMEDAFQMNADFCNMSPIPCYIDIMKQNNKFSVDENGITGATSTIVVATPIGSITYSDNLIIDQPFYFTIKDRWTGMILYAGHITKLGMQDCTIKQHDNQPTKTPIYDLQGRKLNSEPERGIYIKNGRKVAK